MDVSQYSESIAASQRIGMVASVGLKKPAVEAFAAENGIDKWDAPVIMAAVALGASAEKAEAIASNGSAFTKKEVPASQYKSTGHWGSEEIYYIQIQTRYL